jgi:integrase
MTGTVRHAKLESRTARARLRRGRQPHWQALVPGRAHLGYQRREDLSEGRWLLRRYVGMGGYRTVALGRADDAAAADGERVLSFEQAEAKARGLVETPPGAVHRLTVRGAVQRYVEFKRAEGQSVSDLLSRARAHILPALGELIVTELTAERLRSWLATLAAAPAQTRPKGAEPKYMAPPVTDEDVRRRRASANRVLTMLKAALNHAHDEGHVANRDAWGRKLKPFRDVQLARVRYLQVAEAQRVISAADPEFRPLLRAALETGARYGELTRMAVQDFIADAGTVAVRRSKSGKPRHVVLTASGAEFFHQHCAGRAAGELMFRRAAGGAWLKSHQKRPMAAACKRASIVPVVSFHILRHTWASLSVMNGVPLMVVAKNLGHADTRMVEKHYGHMAPSYVAEAIRKGAPRF